MKIYAAYVLMQDGTCIHASTFYPMPESALIAAMISAMQSFIKEVSGSYAKKVSTGGFVFHLDRVGKLIFVLATDKDERPDSEITQIRIRFLHQFGSTIDHFNGVTDQYATFTNDIKEIFNIKEMNLKIEPTNQLNSFALLQIPQKLQKIARQIVMKKELTVKALAEELDLTRFQAKTGLEELFELGYIGRYFDKFDYVYFI